MFRFVPRASMAGGIQAQIRGLDGRPPGKGRRFSREGEIFGSGNQVDSVTVITCRYRIPGK